uniref:LisH domain-containing protein C1711.05-like n=1 Tax=Saccoglossus kowalevskii TaxID=10224 RepID=A0ABM0MCB4_SACKO|nr:PREDICTED: lisH domain-containing protein C1711.05-like [Saccoglossus kowalevskii]
MEAQSAGADSGKTPLAVDMAAQSDGADSVMAPLAVDMAAQNADADSAKDPLAVDMTAQNAVADGGDSPLAVDMAAQSAGADSGKSEHMLEESMDSSDQFSESVNSCAEFTQSTDKDSGNSSVESVSHTDVSAKAFEDISLSSSKTSLQSILPAKKHGLFCRVRKCLRPSCISTTKHRTPDTREIFAESSNSHKADQSIKNKNQRKSPSLKKRIHRFFKKSRTSVSLEESVENNVESTTDSVTL